MKRILLGTILTLISVNSFALALYPNITGLIVLDQARDSSDRFTMFNVLSTTNGLTSSTTAASPLAGLVMFLDNDQMVLDMESEALLDELDVIELKLENNEELTDLQKAIVIIGKDNNQF